MENWHPYGDTSRWGDYEVEIEIRDGNGALVGVIGDYIEGSVSFSSDASDVEASSFTLPWSSPWARTVMRANQRLILIHIIIRREGVQITEPWTGMVDRAVRKMEGPQGSITVELVSDKIHLKRVLAWSAPGSGLGFQLPKTAIYTGSAIHTLKRILSDNLLRITDNQPFIGTSSIWFDRSNEWASIHEKMPNMIPIPTSKKEDTAPTLVTQVAMTPVDEVWQEPCKDLNLLPKARMYIPGRDPVPERINPVGPTILFDIIDKEKARTRVGSDGKSWWDTLMDNLGDFVRGLFGQYDAPQGVVHTEPESLKVFFGDRPEDPWVIFRDSPAHWASREVCAYSPTSSTSISGGKTQGFLNKGLQLGFNVLLNSAFAAVGLGFLGLDVGGSFDDILFAYQKSDSEETREYFGNFLPFEEFVGDGLTAYSFDAAQALRQARHNAIGYQTAMFTGDMASFKPFRPFEDFDLLDPVGWEDEIEDRIFTERVKQISVDFSRDNRISFEVRLGELDRPEEPEAIAQRRHESIVRALNTITRRD